MPQVWLEPGMFVAALDGVKVSGITVGDDVCCVLRWVVRTVFLRVGAVMVGGSLCVPGLVVGFLVTGGGLAVGVAGCSGGGTVTA